MNSRVDRNNANRLRTTLVSVCLAALAAAGLTSLLFARVALDPALEPRPPLTVSYTHFRLSDTFERQVSYLGLVAAGRKANLGFEIPGQISTLSLRQGSPVKSGEVIAELDDSALQARRNATAAELKGAKAELELARLKAKRQRDLRDTGAVSKEAHDETRLRAAALEAQVDAVAARLERLDIEVEKSRLLAPYDGVVADRYLNQGAIVSPGTPVLRLVESASREAHIGVAANRVHSLVPGDAYEIALRDEVFSASLLSVRPDVDPLTRSTTAVFAIPAEARALDGEPLTLRLPETVSMKGGWLPLSALQEGRRGLWTVLRLDPVPDEAEQQLFRTRREAVEVLESRGDRVYVRGTLADGARVVASGVHRLTPDVLVRLQADR